TPEKLYAIVIEALAFHAAALDAQASPAGQGTITPVELTTQLALDIRDGRLDGVNASVTPPVTLAVSGVPILEPGQTFGRALADAVRAAATSADLPGLSDTDAEAVAVALEGAGNQADGGLAFNANQPEIDAVSSAFPG